MNQATRITFRLDAGPNERYSERFAESLIGQTPRLNLRLAEAGPVLADYGTATVVAAEVVDDGAAVLITYEARPEARDLKSAVQEGLVTRIGGPLPGMSFRPIEAKPAEPVARPRQANDDYVELTAADLAHRWRERTVLESVDEAIASAGSAEEYATPDSALRWLLTLAWGDLQSARHHALNGRWSIDCDGQVCRIVGLTRLVGPLSWEHVDVDLILDGVYERIHEALGVPTPLSDDDRQRAQAVMERRNRP